MPRVAVLGSATRKYAELVREAGANPLPRELPGTSPRGGVALRREWVADRAEVFCSEVEPEALLVGPCGAEDMSGLILAALRLDLPMVVAPDGPTPFDVVPYALGLVPPEGEPVEVAVELARWSGEARARRLVTNFSLANALRAGLSAGGGPELLVHLAAVAREAGISGFSQMMRVLAPESRAVVGLDRLQKQGPAGLLAGMRDVLNDTPTVAGPLKEGLPPAPPLPDAQGQRLFFVRGRASGTQAVCRASGSMAEVAGECRVFASEEEAVQAVEESRIGEGQLLVVTGCGARGGPGLLALDGLGTALAEAGLEVAVLTDGLPPSEGDGPSPWISLFSPEAALGGVIGLLRDGDTLRFDLARGRVLTGVSAEDLASREPFRAPNRSPFGYSSRYARLALPALEGAGSG